MDFVETAVSYAKKFMKGQRVESTEQHLLPDNDSPVEMLEIVRAHASASSTEGAHEERALPKPFYPHTSSTWVRMEGNIPQDQEDEPASDDDTMGGPSPPHSESPSSSTWERSAGGGGNRTSIRGIECLRAPLWVIGVGVVVIAVATSVIAAMSVIAYMRVPDKVVAAAEAAAEAAVEAAAEAAVKEDELPLQIQQDGGYSPLTVYSVTMSATELLFRLVCWYAKAVVHPLVNR